LLVALVSVGACNKADAPAQANKKAAQQTNPAEVPLFAIMRRLGAPPRSIYSAIDRTLKFEPVQWAFISNQAQLVSQLAAAVGLHEPPKGDKESWAKSVAALEKTATDLDKAGKANDLKAAKDALAAMHKACDQCHNVHRPEGKE
jgi:hypothetical protein